MRQQHKRPPCATSQLQGQALGQHLLLQRCPRKLGPFPGWNPQSSQGQCKGVQPQPQGSKRRNLGESRNSPPPCSQLKALGDFREKALPSNRNQLENDAQQTQSPAKGILQMGPKHKPGQVLSSSIRSTKRSPQRSSGTKVGLLKYPGGLCLGFPELLRALRVWFSTPCPPQGSQLLSVLGAQAVTPVLIPL